MPLFFFLMLSPFLHEVQKLYQWVQVSIPLVPSYTVHSPMPRDYFQEVEATVAGKVTTWQIQHLSLWGDYIEPKTSTPAISGADEVIALEDEATAARFREVKAKLAKDISAMTAYNNSVSASKKTAHVVSVMHEKAQQQVP